MPGGQLAGGCGIGPLLGRGAGLSRLWGMDGFAGCCTGRTCMSGSPLWCSRRGTACCPSPLWGSWHRGMRLRWLPLVKGKNQKRERFELGRRVAEFIRPYTPARPLRSTTSGRLAPPARHTCTARSRLLSVLAPRWWNDLPVDVRTAERLSTFKRRLKTYLFRLHLSLPHK